MNGSRIFESFDQLLDFAGVASRAESEYNFAFLAFAQIELDLHRRAWVESSTDSARKAQATQRRRLCERTLRPRNSARSPVTVRVG